MVDARTLAPGTVLRADVCVVGSGAAGATLVAELTGSGLSVICLEAGGWRQERLYRDANRGSFDPDTLHDPMEMVRQRRIGGTTWQWGGRCLPLDPIDFEDRAPLRAGWPFQFEELLPYYRRTHQYCQLGHYEYTLGEVLPEPPKRFVPAGGSSLVDDQRVWRWSPPVRFGRSLRRLVAGDRSVELYHHANVVGLERHSGTDRVERVIVASAPGRQLSVEARAFVLATGCLEAARLLLAPTEDSPRGTGNDHDQVGRHYMTHPVGEVGRVALTQPGEMASGFFFSRDGVYCRRMLKLTQEAQRRQGLLNLAASLWYPDPRDPSHGDPLLSAFALARLALSRSGLEWKSGAVHRRFGEPTPVAHHLVNLARGSPRVVRYAGHWARHRWLSARALPSFSVDEGTPGLRLRFDAEQTPDPENRLTLDRSRDAFNLPRLRMRYRVSEDDRENIRRSLTMIADEVARSGTARVELWTGTQGPDDLRFGDGTHAMGATRMADSPRLGVVDRDCRVHGAPNLFVASSAVFPSSGIAGPTLTIVALAVRMADRLVRELGSPVTTRPSGAQQ